MTGNVPHDQTRAAKWALPADIAIGGLALVSGYEQTATAFAYGVFHLEYLPWYGIARTRQRLIDPIMRAVLLFPCFLPHRLEITLHTVQLNVKPQRMAT